jgi:conjugative transfer region protein (TIGR03748 family)
MVWSRITAPKFRTSRTRGTVLAMHGLLACFAALAQPAAEVRIARYTSTATTPELAQVDPLEAVVHLTFPRSNVQTVGDAVAYLLQRSGYRLQAEQALAPPVQALLLMPLPEVHRRLGPCSVRTALSVIAGPPFVLSIDASQRIVSFTGASATVAGASVAKNAGRAGNGETR